MKLCAFLLFAFAFASAQTTPAVGPTMTIDWPTATLPDVTIGIGPSWTRGDAHAMSADVSVAFRIGASPAYEWSTVSTPVARVLPGAPPLPSTFTTGFAYVPAQSPSGSISLVVIGQGGMNQSAAGVPSLALTGSIGVAFRIPKTKNFYFMPFGRASKPARGDGGALVSAILQPAFSLLYGLHRK